MKIRIKTFPMLILLFAIFMRMASESTANISYLVLAGYALTGRSQIIQALALSWLFSMINPVIAPEASAASIGRYIVIIAAAISAAWRGRGQGFNKLSVLTFLLGIFMLVHSLLFSVVVDVSILKVTSWIVVVVTLVSSWQGISSSERTVLFDQLQMLLVGLMLLSLPLLAFPTIGYARNGSGFQGLLNHPQAFGPTLALIGAMLGGRILDMENPRWRDLSLFVLCMVLIVLSEARTAGLALVLGLFGSVVILPVFARKSLRQMIPGLRSRRLQVFWLVSILVIVVSGPALVSNLSSYLLKHSGSTSFADAVEASRGQLASKMINNIQIYPFSGIGFGIASDPETMEVEREPLFGLPIAAPIEKGVMPLAVIEEMGLFGGLAVFCWILVFLSRGARAGVTKIALMLTLLLVNFGESMFFSVGGMGMLLLILLTGAAAPPALLRSNKRV
jgi:hypothetical protein